MFTKKAWVKSDGRPLLRRLLALAILVIATLWAVALPATSSADAASVSEVKIITLKDGKDPKGGMPLLGGGSATPFSLGIPVGAQCPGDSAEGGYRVQGYFVSESYSPISLQFGSNGPVPVSMGSRVLQPLFDASTTASYANIQTAKADVPKGPGLLVSLPAFNFAVFSKGNIIPGVYNLGVACTLGPASRTQVKRVWNARLTMQVDESDPVGVRWVAAPAGQSQPEPLTSGGTSTSVTPTGQKQSGGTDQGNSSITPSSSVGGAVQSLRGTESIKASAPLMSLPEDGTAKSATQEKFGGQPTSPHVLELVIDSIPSDPSSWPTAARILLPVLLAGVAVRGLYVNRLKFIPSIQSHPAEV